MNNQTLRLCFQIVQVHLPPTWLWVLSLSCSSSFGCQRQREEPSRRYNGPSIEVQHSSVYAISKVWFEPYVVWWHRFVFLSFLSPLSLFSVLLGTSRAGLLLFVCAILSWAVSPSLNDWCNYIQAFVITFSFGMGAIPWLMMSEV